MKDHGISLNKHCPCVNQLCPIRGNCVLCIQNHYVHKRHIPQCMQNVLRPIVQTLSDKMELDTTDSRPSKNFWEKFDKDEFLQKFKKLN